MARVITASELERMRSSIAPISNAEKNRIDKKAQLKQLSADRVQHWPNTLEANRTKKESFMKDREAQDELKRQEIDKQEAEIRRQSRLDSITRANTLLYEQTDRMKQLRSQKLYADVIHNRQQQISQKGSAVDEEKFYEAAYHNGILEQVKRGEEEDRMKAAMAADRTRLITEARKSQLNDTIARKEAEVRERKMIGLALKERTEEMLLEEKRLLELKQMRANQNKNEVVAANEKLKQMRIHMSSEERRAEEARDEEIRTVEERKNALKEIGNKHYEKAQRKRQIIIDAATQNLAQRSSNEREILYKQETDIKEREERELAMKEMKKKKEWETIVKSRTEQMSYREEQAFNQMDEDSRMAQLWRSTNEAAIEEDRQKAKHSRERVKDIKSMQLADSISVQRKKIDQRIAEIENDRILQMAEGDVDAKFVAACKEEIRRYAAESKPVHPLLVALNHKQPDIIAGRKIPVPKRTSTA